MKSFVIAFGLMTRIPMPSTINAKADCYGADSYGRAVLWFPVVGLAIGIVILAIAYLASYLQGTFSSLLTAVLVVASWVYLTGGLHIDGLADSADAWTGGMGNKQRTLEIMKDPTAGPSAVTAITLNLLLKTTAVYTLIQQQMWIAIALAPVIARVLCVLLYATTRYAKEIGMGAIMVEKLPRTFALLLSAGSLLAIALFSVIVIPPLLAAIAAAIGVFYLLRRRMQKRIGGLTGDTTGESIEIVESVWLTAAALAAAANAAIILQT